MTDVQMSTDDTGERVARLDGWQVRWSRHDLTVDASTPDGSLSVCVSPERWLGGTIAEGRNAASFGGLGCADDHERARAARHEALGWVRDGVTG